MKPLEVIHFAELKIVCRFTFRLVRLMHMIQPYTEIQYCKCSRTWMFLFSNVDVVFNGKQTKGRLVQSKSLPMKILKFSSWIVGRKYIPSLKLLVELNGLRSRNLHFTTP